MAFQADSIFWVEVEKIVPNPFQPRREFDEAKLKELAESVRMYGILQPLTVTRREIQGEDGSFRSEYELIAGERRLRASKLAGLQLVPVIIRDGEQTEQEKLELAIIENLQREDLNAVDRALAFRQLADVFGLSHSQVAQKVGRSREYVSNSIRLLALPEYMLDALRTNDMTEGHARTLLMLNDRPEEQDVVFREILLKKLSVREVEKIARGIATEKVRKKHLVDNDLIAIEQQFTDALGTRVSITKTDFGGRVTIDYFSVEDLEEILERMKQDAKRAAVSSAYRDESKDTVVSDVVDEEVATLATLAAATGIAPVVSRAAVATDALVTHPAAVVDDRDVEGVSAAVVDEVPVVELSQPMVGTAVVTQSANEAAAAATMVASREIADSVPVVPPREDVTQVPVAVPAVSPSVVVPSQSADTPVAPTANTPRLSLREQLASLLAKPAVAPTVPPVPAAAPVVPPVVVASDDKDDSDLYAINRFTI